VDNFSNRNPDKVYLPVKPVEFMTGFPLEAVLGRLEASLTP